MSYTIQDGLHPILSTRGMPRHELLFWMIDTPGLGSIPYNPTLPVSQLGKNHFIEVT